MSLNIGPGKCLTKRGRGEVHKGLSENYVPYMPDRLGLYGQETTTFLEFLLFLPRRYFHPISTSLLNLIR